jgi:DNA (cytosine-5)-methyltransferase 1
VNVIDLFSGIGGFSLGLERAGMRTVAFCESEPFCRAVLAKHWPTVPCYDDVRTLTANRLAADGISADVICGGFPCQDISYAGKGAGLAGKRSGLWYEFHRLIAEIRPQYAFIENVSALRSRGLGEVLRSLTEIGYDAEWHCIPASAVGAPHRRDRIWIVAYPNNKGKSISPFNAEAQRLQIAFADSRWNRWFGKPEDVRMDDGLSNGMDRVKALGNAVVPKIPEIIGQAIMRHESQ